MAVGLTDRIRDIRRLTDLVLEHRLKPGKVGAYKLRAKLPMLTLPPSSDACPHKLRAKLPILYATQLTVMDGVQAPREVADFKVRHYRQSEAISLLGFQRAFSRRRLLQ